jgi:F-type H+-transporting ATPase subunit b
MEAIIAAFGIDVHLIVVQIINFTILMVALGYFLYTPVLNLLHEREEKIAAGIKDAEAAATAKASAEVEKAAVLTEAHHAAAEVNARAKVTAEVAAAEIVAAAETAAHAAKAKAVVEAEQLKAAAIKASEAEIAKTAILAAEKILREKSA